MIGDSILFMQRRSIAGYLPDVVIEEHHDDFLTVTRHPVEEGAAIADHAFKNPAILMMRVAWTAAAAVDYLGVLFGGKVTTIREVYDALLRLQASRQPFQVVSGKRTYDNMVLVGLSVITERDTENILEVKARFEQIIITYTQVIQVSGMDPQNLASPQKASPIAKLGTKQAVTTPNGDDVASKMGFYGVPM